MSSQNYFDLLGDDENEEPTAVVVRATLPSATDKVAVKKSPVAEVATPARLPVKQSPSSEPVKDHKLGDAGRMGGRGRGRTGRGGGGGGGGRGRYGDREREGGSHELSSHREGREGFSRDRGGFNSDRYVPSNPENDTEGSQGPRVGGYGGVAHGTANTGSFDGNRPRGRGAGRGRDRGDGEERPRRREYDRRSGSGFGNEVKREGSGRGNWGAEGDEGTQLEPEVVAPTNPDVKIATPEKEADSETPAGVAAPTTEETAERKVVEEEDNELTLDEYEKILEERRKALLASKAEERKVQADKAFDSMHLVDKKNDQDDVFIKLGSDKEKKKKEKEAVEKEEKAKKTQSINEFLKPVDGEKYYGSTGNRGRGGNRGREGRGGDGERSGGFGGGRSNFYGGFNNTRRMSAPRIEDPGQFPILEPSHREYAV